MRLMTDEDATTEGRPVITGDTGPIDPGTGLPTPVGPILTRRTATINWTHQEPQPAGSLQGFEVAVFVGDDPNNSASYVVEPVILGPTDRSLQVLLELRSQQSVKAAVRALYPDGYKSPWTPAPAAAVFTPETQAYGTSGSLKFPDGTIMQWKVTDLIAGQDPVVVPFPIPFPTRCYMAQVTTENIDGNRNNDAWFQIRGYDRAGVTVFRQSSNSGADGMVNKAHILAFGY